MKKEIVNDKNLTLQDIISTKTEEAIENDTGELVSLIAIAEMTDLKKIKTISRIKDTQVPILAKLHLFSDKFNVPFIAQLADNIEQLQISINGYGRRELVQVVNQTQPQVVEKRGLFSRPKEVFR